MGVGAWTPRSDASAAVTAMWRVGGYAAIPDTAALPGHSKRVEADTP